MLCAIFFGQSAVISSSQLISLTSRPSLLTSLQTITAIATALVTTHAQQVELAD
jgi:hypothetical protein